MTPSHLSDDRLAAPAHGPGAPSRARVGVLVAAVAAGVVALRVRDPHTTGSWGICPVLAVTGQYCPGCGALRAVYDLAGGDLASAVGSNALLLLIGLPVLAFHFAGWARGRGQRSYPAWAYVALGVLVAAFALLRNLAVGSALAP